MQLHKRGGCVVGHYRRPHLKALCNEVTQVAAEVVRAGIRFELYSRVRPSEMASELIEDGSTHRGRRVLQSHHEHFHGRVLCKGRVTVCQLKKRNAQGPAKDWSYKSHAAMAGGL
jgi:hypothetical protein